MVIPVIIPIIYCLFYKKESLGEILVITFSMILIVVLYWSVSLILYATANIYAKFLLFVLLPLFLLFLYDRSRRYISKSDKTIFDWSKIGINSEGVEKSLKWGFIFLPLMLIITFIMSYVMDLNFGLEFSVGVVYFVESLSEEFFFRGVLFLFLMNKTNLQVAYVTSLGSFVLMYPQHFTNVFIISTIVQGILTIEICRRTRNLLGAWMLHGTNRFFGMVVIPFLL